MVKKKIKKIISKTTYFDEFYKEHTDQDDMFKKNDDRDNRF